MTKNTSFTELTRPGYLDNVKEGDRLLAFSSWGAWSRVNYRYHHVIITRATKTKLIGRIIYVEDGIERIGILDVQFRRGRGPSQFVEYRGEGMQLNETQVPMRLYLDTPEARAWIEPRVAEADAANENESLIAKIRNYRLDDWRNLSTEQLQSIVDMVELSEAT